MVSACSFIMFLILILFRRVDVVFAGGVFCSPERSLPRYSRSSAVECYVASLISFDHWASKVYGIGN